MSRLTQVKLDKEFLSKLNPVWNASSTYAKKYIEKLGEEEANYYSRAYEFDGSPVCCWGVYKEWDKVGTIYIVFDKRAHGCLKSIVKQAKKDLDYAFERDFRRLSAVFDIDAPTLPMMKTFGFDYCGVYRNYGIGGHGTFYSFERIS